MRRKLAVRAAIVILLYLAVMLMFWAEREGLVDHHDGHISLADIVYFSVVTVTTVGYGDIVPITDGARMVDALLVTPIRLFIWLIFLGTAYQLVLQRFIEDLRMRILQRKLSDHVIICGFGHAGRCAAAELVSRGMDSKQILIIDLNQARLEEAAEYGYIGLLGNATREESLGQAMLDTARAIFVCTDRDDTNVLIVLTARHVSSTVRIVARVEEAENEKLLKQSGADMTVLPSRMGGILMAGSLDSAAIGTYILDLMSAGGGVTLVERQARTEDIGKLPTEIGDAIVVRVVRAGQELTASNGNARIQSGDKLIVIRPEPLASQS